MDSRRSVLVFALVVGLAALPLLVPHESEVPLVIAALVLAIGAAFHRARLARL